MSESPSARKLSLLDATMLVMGGIIGVGIFFTPQAIAERVFEPWAFLTIWLFGGLVGMCAAMTFAELGATFPKTGGWFVFLREAFGAFPAFLFAWVVLFVISTGAMAAILTFCVGMLHNALPSLVDPPGTGNHRAIAIGILLFLTTLTIFGVKRAALLQNLCMVAKLAVLAALIVAGLVFYTPGTDAAAASVPVVNLAAAASVPVVNLAAAASVPVVDLAVEMKGSLWAGMLAALLPVLFSYGGWQLVCYVASEVEDPARTLPRAIVIGVAAVILVYLLANLSFLRVLGIEAVAADEGFASRMARETLGARGERILSAGMAVSALGVCAVNVIVSPWLYVAMARERLFFARFARLHPRTGTPVAALVVQAAIVLFYLYAATLQYLVDAVVFVEWIFHGLVAVALLRLRRVRPELPRPFRSLAYPAAPLIYLAAAVMVVAGTLVQAELRLKLSGLIVLAVGALLYRPWRRALARTGSGG